MVDSALGWSGIEDDDRDMPNGEKGADGGPPVVGDKPEMLPKPCGAALGNIVLLDREDVYEGGDVVKRGGGDDMV